MARPPVTLTDDNGLDCVLAHVVAYEQRGADIEAWLAYEVRSSGGSRNRVFFPAITLADFAEMIKDSHPTIQYGPPEGFDVE